ncbi:MAG: hypothetical protein ACREUD_06160 [Gammaproteobacteria bacterium]
MRGEAIYEQGVSSSLTLTEAAGLLGVDERSLRLGRALYSADDFGLSEPPWARAIPVNELIAMQEFY